MKSYRDNGGGGGFGARSKTVYDDVFGGPPKFGAPTLPPRHEDYTEIFQGFHASRGSSIPVLDLPPACDGSDDVWCDVRASKLDYSEVFGGFSGLDFAVSYEELFGGSGARGDDSSDEVWTPAQSELLSDESDPYVSLEMNQLLSNADPELSFGIPKQFKLSKNIDSLNTETDTSENDCQFLDVPGSTLSGNQTLSSNIEFEKFSSQANSDYCANEDVGGVTEGKRLKKALSQPLDSGFGTERYRSDLDLPVGNRKADHAGDKPLFSVSDISLKTQPSQLPPPSRPPPTLASKKGDSGRFSSKLKTSKSYAFERRAGDSSPPYFDVEVDASSSAAVSAAAMKNAVEQAEAQLRSAKELMDRKEGLQSRSKMRMEHNVKEECEGPNGFDGDKMKVSHERGSGRTAHEVREERRKKKDTIKVVTGSAERENNISEVGNSVKRKTEKEHICQGLNEIKVTVVSREATQFEETVSTHEVKDASRVFRPNGKAVPETFEQQEDSKNLQRREVCGSEENKERRETVKRSDGEKEHVNKPTVAQKACEPKEREMSFLVSHLHEEMKAPSVTDEKELYENLIEIQLKDTDMGSRGKQVRVNENVVIENPFENDNGRKGYCKGSAQTSFWEEYDLGSQEAIEQEYVRRQETLEQDTKESQQRGPPEIEISKSEEGSSHEGEESERVVIDSPWQEENEKRFVLASEQEESDNMSETVLEQDENRQEKTLESNETLLQTVLMQEKDKENAEAALEHEEKVKRQEIACEGEENEQALDHAWANEETEKRHDMVCNSAENRKIQGSKEKEESEDEAVFEKEGLKKKPDEVSKWEDDDKRINSKKENGSATEDEDSEASHVAYQVDDDEILQATGDLPLCSIPSEKVEATPETTSCVKNRKPSINRYDEKVVGAVEQARELGEESFFSSGLNQGSLQHAKDEAKVAEAINSNGDAGRSHGGNAIGQTQMENDKRTTEANSGLENANSCTHDQRGKRTNFKDPQSGVVPGGRTNISTSSQVARKWAEATGKPLPDQVYPSRNTNTTAPKVASRSMERKEESRNKTLSEDRERELENDRLRKLEEERERQIEREKDRMAVDRATLEARERAFAEARERAERAAVERATADFRQRALAEARERLEKACAEARERSLTDKASEARLRAERAAAEKATAEARERAERSVVDKLSASRSSGMRQNSLSSDLPDSQFQKVGSFSGLRYTTASHSGSEGESPQRCKARLERHQRTADRAAKALAEKNMRDLIAQKEQTERNRLAEGLDAEVKRWSSGKQGNLRALLSTLQYILGPESGWQPVPLTEVITTAAVKKAYRKATLCVHPDKLQQRGASIQQKYICEKVFDLLKEAWNKFNSEER